MNFRSISYSQIKNAAQEAFEECKNITGGENANYIPFLANVPSDLFGLSITLPDGKRIEFGDCNYVFGVESISKVFTAILVMKNQGSDIILDKIGADATGLPFNSIYAILLENDHPSTPLVNAGAIAACSLIEPKGDSNKKWEKIISNFNNLCGRDLSVIDTLYKSESSTNFNNRSIAWLLKNYNRIYDDPDMSLDLYTRQCSIGITASDLSTAAVTIACDGYNSVTKQQVFSKELSPQIISLIATVGFYQTTGDWMYTAGIPAKSGVGGGVMAIVPGVMGIAAFAPPLDKVGNSVKAQAVIKELSRKLDLNVFNNSPLVYSE